MNYGVQKMEFHSIFLSSCLRFHNKGTRSAEDRLAPIREIWTIVINNCTRFYQSSKLLTVDEQFRLGFRGRCRFRVYMKTKPDKYRLKIVTLNDANTFYLINAIPYLGKSQGPRNESVPDYFFREVTTPVHGTNKRLTTDNWYMSIPLMQKMKEEPYKMLMTGTIRKNKRDIPAEMKVAGKEIPSSKYGFHEGITLVSHTPEKKKIVLLTSNYIKSTESDGRGKPVIILHYNRTKRGTDTFDQLCHAFTTSRGTRRWPMRYFLGILDQARINSRILHTCKWIKINPKY